MGAICMYKRAILWWQFEDQPVLPLCADAIGRHQVAVPINGIQGSQAALVIIPNPTHPGPGPSSPVGIEFVLVGPTGTTYHIPDPTPSDRTNYKLSFVGVSNERIVLVQYTLTEATRDQAKRLALRIRLLPEIAKSISFRAEVLLWAEVLAFGLGFLSFLFIIRAWIQHVARETRSNL